MDADSVSGSVFNPMFHMFLPIHTNNLSWHTTHYGIIRNIACHYSIGSDYDIITNLHITNNLGSTANHHIVAQRRITATFSSSRRSYRNLLHHHAVLAYPGPGDDDAKAMGNTKSSPYFCIVRDVNTMYSRIESFYPPITMYNGLK